MRILVATTLAAFVMDQEDTWSAWLRTIPEMRDEAERRGDTVDVFASIEVDARGFVPFQPLETALDSVAGDHWVYSLDDGRTEVNTGNRLRHIVAGQNLCNDYAVAGGYDFMLFMAADCMPPAGAPWKLIEAHHDFDAQIVGGEVTTYCLSGPDVAPWWYPAGATFHCLNAPSLADWVASERHYPVQEHMPTAAFVLLSRLAFRKLRWRWDFEDGSDDPCLYADALARGYRVVVRKDVVGKHYPEAIGDISTRGHNMEVVR